MTLRSARVTDLPLIYRGEQHYIRTWEPDHEHEWRLQLDRHLTRWVQNFERLTIAMVDDEWAGYCLWTPEDDLAELCTIHVSPGFRRRGVGQALLGAYMDSARQKGFYTFALSLRPDNPARHLYERAGFQCMGSDTRGYLKYRCHS